MANTTVTPPSSLEDLIRALAGIARTGSPTIARLALWLQDRPEELAFQSVRGLAALSGANVNTVYRVALALGFHGYDECRQAVQAALRSAGGLYGPRAAQLARHGETMIHDLCAAAHANLDEALSEENIAKIRRAAARLLAARRIYCIGVRSCFSLAHYLSYTGSMAFANFERPLMGPGSIADILAHADPGDTVVLITFPLYSAEIVEAHTAARAQGLDILAITDGYGSPIARGADEVFCLPMAGPQPLPTHGAGFALVEAIVSEMITASAEAPSRIAEFERRLADIGSYVTPRGAGAPKPDR